MSQEMKCHLDDAKDFAHQTHLEAKIKGRVVKGEALRGIVDATGHELTNEEAWGGVKMMTTDAVHNAEDAVAVAAIDVKRKARGAKVALDQSAVKQKADDAAVKTGDALEDAKDAVVDAFTPATKVVEGESARGVDITHIEGGANARVVAKQNKQAQRTKRDQERDAEKKRQKLVKDTKAKASEVATAVGATLTKVGDKAAVVVGKAALAMKDKLDDYTDDRPREKVTPRVSDSGVDISAVQNARNDELLAREQREAELQKAQEKPFVEKAKDAITGAVDTIKDTVTAATTEAPTPVYVHKTSSSGVDISHLENPANPTLLERDAERARLEAEEATKREKAVLNSELVEPLKEDAVKAEDSLKTKMASLGQSLSKAAHKLGASIQGVYQDLAHPPVVHEQKSERGVDITTIENPDNEKIGEAIREKNAILPATSKPSDAHVEPASKDGITDTIIKKTLDAGVAIREAGASASAQATHFANEVEYKAKIAAAEADIAAQELKQKTALEAEKLKLAAKETGRDIKDGAVDLKNAASEKLSAAKESIAPSSDESYEKPELIRVNTLPVVATASPITPDTYETFHANTNPRQ